MAKQIRQIKKNVHFRSTADPYYTPLLTGQYFSLYVELQLILKFAPKNHRLGISLQANNLTSLFPYASDLTSDR
jgi:hypothetical protein